MDCTGASRKSVCLSKDEYFLKKTKKIAVLLTKRVLDISSITLFCNNNK